MQSFPTQTLLASTTLLATAAQASLEVDTTLRLNPGQSVALHLRGKGSSDPSLTITYDGETLTMGATNVPFSMENGESLRLRLFVDRSVSELFVNDGRLAITTIQPMPITPIDVEAEPHGSPIELLSFTAWELNSMNPPKML
jgi:hypothetical protein